MSSCKKTDHTMKFSSHGEKFTRDSSGDLGRSSSPMRPFFCQSGATGALLERRKGSSPLSSMPNTLPGVESHAAHTLGNRVTVGAVQRPLGDNHPAVFFFSDRRFHQCLAQSLKLASESNTTSTDRLNSLRCSGTKTPGIKISSGPITRSLVVTLKTVIFLMTLSVSLTSCGGLSWASTPADPKVIYTIALEAAGEPLNGQIAVAEVIRNRSSKRHQSFFTVVTAPFQFSCWSGHHRKLTASEIRSAELAWERSATSNLTHGATHYHTITCKPYWSRSVAPVVVIGNHAFFNNIR